MPDRAVAFREMTPEQAKQRLGRDFLNHRVDAGFGEKQEAFAEELGVTGSHLSRIESGKKVPSLDVIRRLSEKFGADYSRLETLHRVIKGYVAGEGAAFDENRGAAEGFFPIIGAVSCGSFDELISAPRGEMRQPPEPVKKSTRAAWIVAGGESMTGELMTPDGSVRIRPGDLLWVEFDRRPKDGQVALVALDGELTVKLWRVHKEKGGDRVLELIPTNPKFRVKTLEEDDAKSIEACVVSYIDPKPMRLP